jgi:acyl-homoserine lactone acylase PvdQ
MILIRLCKLILLVVVLIFALGLPSLYYLYLPRTKGSIYLPHAKGVTAILTEDETGFAHIRGTDLFDAVYGQGYYHA